MIHVLIQHHHLLLKAVSPDTLSAVMPVAKHVVSDKTLRSLPPGYSLQGFIKIFGPSQTPEAAKMVVQQIAEAADTHTLVEQIHHEIVQVREERQELRAAKARLEKMQADGLMKFAAKVDARSFLVLCAIIACGDVAKASRALKMGDSTVRGVVKGWKKLGPAHAVMSDLVRWRKRVGGKYTVPFNDAVLYEKDAAAGNETVFAELLDAVLSMTESNWPDICAELESTLKKHIGK